MDEQAFSYREGIRYIPDTFTYSELPENVRYGLFSEIIHGLDGGGFGVDESAEELYELTCRRTRSLFSTSRWNEPLLLFTRQTMPLLARASWVEVLDVFDEWFPFAFEQAERSLRNPFLGRLTELVNRVNQLFREEGIGWQIDDRRIQRRQSPVLDSRIREATGLLSDARFQAVEQLWIKAVGALNRRPEPDMENCVKDAVAAVEAMANIVAGTNGQELDKLAETLATQSRIPKPLNNTLKQPYYYRGNQPGVTHGSGEPLSARVEDAEYVLNWAAASVVYLSKV
ncbi:MAG: hypothetical protein HYY02_02700 [Chloroflexi bacterium]|nr:hypothetical protein [Chloroflexota bacterium]